MHSLDLELTTSTANTEISIDLHLGTGASAFTVPFLTEQNYKNTGTRIVSLYNCIPMNDNNTLDNGGQFKISTDQDCSIVVKSFNCIIDRR